MFPTRAVYPRPKDWARGIEGAVIPLTDSSSFLYAGGKVPCTRTEFEDAWSVRPEAEANPMNPRHKLLRRQGTFGRTVYTFSGQAPAAMGPLDGAPVLVRRCVAHARENVGSRLAEFIGGAHVNWYGGGKAGIGSHQDTDVGAAIEDPPIHSYTFYRDPEHYRYFLISRDRAQKDVLAALALGHGDVLVMLGKFQKELWHSLPPTHRAAFVDCERINVTVRLWGRAAGVRG